TRYGTGSSLFMPIVRGSFLFGMVRSSVVALSQPVFQVPSVQFDVPKDFAKQARTDVAPLVDRNRGSAAVRMFELPVASLRLAQQTESHPLEGADQLTRFQNGQVAGTHARISTR